MSVNICSVEQLSLPVALVFFLTGSCQQSKQRCRNPFRKSPKWTSACQWRMRSFCGSSTTETLVAPAGCPPHHPPLPIPSPSNHLAAPACSPALLCHPDNDGPLLPVGSPSLWPVPLELRPKLFPLCLTYKSLTLAPLGLGKLYHFGGGELKKSCTEALHLQGHLVLCLSHLLLWMWIKENLRTSM